MNALTFVNVSLLGAVFATAVVMIDHMNKRTRNSVRCGAALLLAGAVAQAYGYFLHWADWTDTLFIGGAAMCLVANLRFPAGVVSHRVELTPAERLLAEKKADRFAYVIGALTLAGVCVAWVSS